MVNFVETSRTLYGDFFVSYNVHSLIHLADDCVEFGTVDSFSCFIFENHLKKIKQMITKNSQPLSQLARRFGENSGEKKKACVENKIIYSHKHNSGPILGQLLFKDFFHYKQLVCKYGILSSIEPNNCVILINHDIILICGVC